MPGSRPDTWMPLYVGDYLADTMQLTTAQHGAYLLLLMAYWRRGGPLPDDDAYLRNVARIDHGNSWRFIRKSLERFFQIRDGEWHHKRVELELLRASQAFERLSAAGKRGGRPSKATTTTLGSKDPREALSNGKEGNGIAAPSTISKDEMFARAIRSGVPLPNLTDHHVAGMVKAGLITKQEAQRCHYSIEGLC